MFGCFTFPKLGCKTKQNKNIFYFFTTQKLGAVAADLLHKSVLGLCLIISRAAKFHLYVYTTIYMAQLRRKRRVAFRNLQNLILRSISLGVDFFNNSLVVKRPQII